MKRTILVVLSILFPILLFFSVKIFILDLASTNYAAIKIDALPKSTVFLNDKEMGTTPFYDEKLAAGEYKIRLLASVGQTVYQPWEIKLKLPGKTLTYISRNLGIREEQSSGQILVLEKLSLEKSVELAIVSTPDGAKVLLDGLDKGKTSLVLKDLTPNDHDIIISKPGYSDQSIRGKAVAGYRLNVIANLARLPEGLATPSGITRPTVDLISTISGQELSRPYVIIKDTPTGFLRVRVAPSLTASEAGQVKPGEKFPLLSEVESWVKIKLPDIFGWVSDQYVEKVK